VIAVAVILAGLPIAARALLGPAGCSWPARAARVGGYAAVLALLLVKSVVERVGYAPTGNPGSPAAFWFCEALFLSVLACNAAGVIALTAQRSPVNPATLLAGTAAGAAAALITFALGPLGAPLSIAGPWPAALYDAGFAVGVLVTLALPAAAARAAVRRAARPSGRPPRDPVQQGAMAGLCAGATAALLVAVLSTATIALLPHDPGLRLWAISHLGRWARTNIYPGGGVRVYVAANSAYAQGYLLVLLGGPLLGAGVGAWAALTAGLPRRAREARRG
jgi:hypothetical protein